MLVDVLFEEAEGWGEGEAAVGDEGEGGHFG